MSLLLIARWRYWKHIQKFVNFETVRLHGSTFQTFYWMKSQTNILVTKYISRTTYQLKML